MAKQERKSRQKKKPNRVLQFLRDARSELRRVVWPTPKEARNLTLVVMVLSAVLGLLMWAFDLLFARGYQALAAILTR